MASSSGHWRNGANLPNANSTAKKFSTRLGQNHYPFPIHLHRPQVRDFDVNRIVSPRFRPKIVVCQPVDCPTIPNKSAAYPSYAWRLKARGREGTYLGTQSRGVLFHGDSFLLGKTSALHRNSDATWVASPANKHLLEVTGAGTTTASALKSSPILPKAHQTPSGDCSPRPAEKT